MIHGSVDMKDAIGPTATGTGFTMATVSPTLILQLIGALIGVFGAVYTRKRYLESQRYNDLYQKRLEWEQEVHASKQVPIGGEEETSQYSSQSLESNNAQADKTTG